MYPTYHDRYGLPGAPSRPYTLRRPAGVIHEFPMPVWRKLGYPLPVGGGGYFRLYPYALTRRGLRAINARGLPFATYLHPWELDPEQPRLAAWSGAQVEPALAADLRAGLGDRVGGELAGLVLDPGPPGRDRRDRAGIAVPEVRPER